MIKRWVLASALAAIVASTVYLISRPSDEARIRDCLSEVSLAVRMDPAEAATPGPRTQRIQAAFADVFSRDATVDVDDLGAVDRDALLGLAVSAGDGLQWLDVDLGEPAVSIDRSKRAAVVTTHVILKAGAAGEVRREEQDLRFYFENVGGDWKITRIAGGIRDH